MQKLFAGSRAVAVFLGLLGSGIGGPSPAIHAQAAIQPTVLNAGGNVVEFVVTADGQRVVFLSDDETAGTFELFTVSVLGGSVTRLNDDLVDGGNITGFRLSPDAAYVVYRADREVDERFNLYAVPLAGGTTTRLNPAMSDDVDPVFEFTPDSSRVVYLGRDPSWFSHLVPHVVAVTGGDSLVLNPLRYVDQGWDFKISPQGGFVTFQARGEPTVPIWSAALDGSSLVQLDSPFAYFFTHSYRWDDFLSDDSGLIYQVSDDRNRENLVLSSPLVGGDSVNLGSGNPSGGFFLEYQVSTVPLNETHYYLWTSRYFTNQVSYSYLFSYGLENSGPSKTLYGCRDDSYTEFCSWAGYPIDFGISNDGSQVVFKLSRTGVKKVPITGEAAPTDIGGTLDGTLAREFKFSPNDEHVVLRTRNTYFVDPDDRDDLWSVPMAGGPAVNLTELEAGRRIPEYWISPDGSKVVFLADRDVVGQMQLYAVPTAGGEPLKLNPISPPDGEVSEGVAITSDGASVIYRYSGGPGGSSELHRVPLDTDGDSDGVLDSVDNCALDANPQQSDADADAVGAACDCNDGDPFAYALPGTIGGLHFTGSPADEIAWVPVDTGAAGAGTTHDVFRGPLPGLPLGDGPGVECLASEIAESSLNVTEDPAPGTGFWYFARGTNSCGGGSLGQGVDRQSPTCGRHTRNRSAGR